MPNLIIQPSGNRNARQHYVDTILNPVPIERMRQYLNVETLTRLEQLYKGGAVSVWGFTPGSNDANFAKWSRIEPGDVALFLRKNYAFASSTVSFKIHNHDLAAELWDYDDKQQTWEYMYFLDEVQSQKVPYSRLNELLGYRGNNNFQQALVLDDAHAGGLIAELDLTSTIYGPAPSHEAYLQSIEPSKEVELDKLVIGKARTEQAYLRSVNFKRNKYAICGICNREFPVSFLVAAHIKKRKECSGEERRDYSNITMPMCKFGCDDLYEKGYIGVHETVIVVKDENLSVPVLDYLSSIEGNTCTYWNSRTSKYFQWHNERMKIAA